MMQQQKQILEPSNYLNFEQRSQQTIFHPSLPPQR